jgi:hypothetical protein
MKFYESSSVIEATPEQVWAVLIDAPAWPDWDSGVDGVDGTIALGERITIRSKAAPGRTFPVKVTILHPPKQLQFSGGMPLGLFRGVRTYDLTSTPAGTGFHMREEYTGPMLGLIWKSIPDLGPSFDTFAHGLKKRAESRD